MRKTITFVAEVELDPLTPYLDDTTIVPALREAMWAMMVKGLFDQSFSPNPPMKFESKSDGRINRYSAGGVDKSELEGFNGIVDDKYKITINIAAQTSKD